MHLSNASHTRILTEAYQALQAQFQVNRCFSLLFRPFFEKNMTSGKLIENYTHKKSTTLAISNDACRKIDIYFFIKFQFNVLSLRHNENSPQRTRKL